MKKWQNCSNRFLLSCQKMPQQLQSLFREGWRPVEGGWCCWWPAWCASRLTQWTPLRVVWPRDYSARGTNSYRWKRQRHGCIILLPGSFLSNRGLTFTRLLWLMFKQGFRTSLKAYHHRHHDHIINVCNYATAYRVSQKSYLQNTAGATVHRPNHQYPTPPVSGNSFSVVFY